MSSVFEIYRDSFSMERKYFVKFRTYIYTIISRISLGRGKKLFIRRKEIDTIFISFDLSICPSFLLARCNKYNETPIDSRLTVSRRNQKFQAIFEQYFIVRDILPG